MTEVSTNLGYPPEDRIKRRPDYQRVQRSKRRVHTKHYLLVLAPRPAGALATASAGRRGGRSRLGITVTKKVGNAVQRNRVKRVMREVFRRNRDLFPAADIVVIAKRGAPSVDYTDALEEVQRVRSAMRKAAAAFGSSRPTDGRERHR